MADLSAQLAALLCPGEQRVTPQQLAERLRDVAAELERSGSEAAAQTAPALEVPPPCDAAAADASRSQSVRRKLDSSASSFDISRYPQRLVALEVFYAGWHYHGFATQGHVCHGVCSIRSCLCVCCLLFSRSRFRRDGPGSAETVESHLFAALKATRLVSPDATWSGVEYSRCGRTDAGVSALRQVRLLALCFHHWLVPR